jgi:hypothetical protein
LEDIVLGGEALLEFLSSSVEYGRAEFSRRQVRTCELSAFLVFSNVFETVVDPPIYYAESLVQDQLDPILEEAESEVDQEVEAKMSDLRSHVWGIGDVVERL